MNKYEIACVFKPADVNFEAGKKEFFATLDKLGIKKIDEEDLGIKTIAFPIKKQYQGHYIVYQVESPKNVISLIPMETRLQENLLRTLTIKL